MKFQKSTLILMLSALFLTGIVYTWEKEGRPQIEAKKLKENQIFDFEEKDVQSLVLKTKDYTLQFDKNGKFGSNLTEPKWLMTVLQGQTKSDRSKDSTPTPTESPKDTAAKPSPSPKPTESPKDTATKPSPSEREIEIIPKQIAANDAYVSYLLNLIAKGKAERIQIDPRQGDGLDTPLATIDIKLNNQQTDKLILGNANFNNTFLYALANPPQKVQQPLEILLVSTDFRNAVERPLSEWKQEEQKKPISDKGVEKTPPKDTNSEPKNESDKNNDRQDSNKSKSPDAKPKTPAPEKPKR